MTAFTYRDGQLHCENVALAAIAADAGSPVYVYSANAMRRQLRGFQVALGQPAPLICYALKANHNLAVIRLFSEMGAGADTVSMGEIKRALAAGVPPKKIVFAGVAKGDDEIEFALQNHILQFNVESVPELKRISALAAKAGKTAPIALRINPDVAANTHTKISTGRKSDKFGIAHDAAFDVFRLAMELPGVEPVGMHLHIGSQITELTPFAAAYRRAVELFKALGDSGIRLRRLNLGGGFGVRYKDEERVDPNAFAILVRELTKDLDVELMMEPGRSLVAEAGVLVASVIYRKITEDRQFAILDAGMNTLIRPAMYDAFHQIDPVDGNVEQQLAMDVVGPICESSDVFGRDRRLPPLQSGDLVAFKTAGAYGQVMSSDYNTRPRAAEVLVDEDRYCVIKPRVSAEAQYANECIPDWLR